MAGLQHRYMEERRLAVRSHVLVRMRYVVWSLLLRATRREKISGTNFLRLDAIHVRLIQILLEIVLQAGHTWHSVPLLGLRGALLRCSRHRAHVNWVRCFLHRARTRDMGLSCAILRPVVADCRAPLSETASRAHAVGAPRHMHHQHASVDDRRRQKQPARSFSFDAC